ncbi:hypothetical protein Zmor_012722 [Zophobas morio]|uniref:Uncharacterized protein n=1 Tax=Zophobas morio TaxID=2755281 RepID=A0AA38I9J0_9CUCU|nr:hypothetical protein Zmor_008617 [Zophobas morio]KAJ3653473.1 hypothetical protein Zmor_012722 [Zophobas morio]
MEAYYDGEIAWGPVTLPEAKDELQKTPTRISRSRSDMSCYSLKSEKRERENRECEDGTGRRGSSLLVDLNDTVKEMEMALMHGLDYDMPGDEPEETKPEEVFKVPAPLKLKNCKSVKNKYEHVVSPVGLYIKSGEWWDDNNKENALGVSAKRLFFKSKHRF